MKIQFHQNEADLKVIVLLPLIEFQHPKTYVKKLLFSILQKRSATIARYQLIQARPLDLWQKYCIS